MNNKFINYNGETLLHTQNKKTKVEVQIEELKNQEQEMITELNSWETKQKKTEQLLGYLKEVNEFSTNYLAEVEKAEKDKENFDDWWLEYLIRDKVEFAFKFKLAKEVFTNLVFQKIENQVRHLKSQLGIIQKQLSRQERIFARMEARRQGRAILPCKLNDRLGCLGSYQCDNCQINYSVIVDNNQAPEIAK